MAYMLASDLSSRSALAIPWECEFLRPVATRSGSSLGIAFESASASQSLMSYSSQLGKLSKIESVTVKPLGWATPCRSASHLGSVTHWAFLLASAWL